MNNKEWFRQAQFGMMVHWGLYALLAGEWNGQRTPFIGEWAQSYFRIPGKEYSQLANVFSPILFNAEQWVKLAIDSGMKYLVVTSKHPSWLKAVQYTRSRCRSGGVMGTPEWAAQTRAVPSSLAVTTNLLSGENSALQTQFECFRMLTP